MQFFYWLDCSFSNFGFAVESPGQGCDEGSGVTICRNSDGSISEVICGKCGKCSKGDLKNGGNKKTSEKKSSEKTSSEKKSRGEDGGEGTEKNASAGKKNSDSGSCFPAAAMVGLEDGMSKEMRYLKLGDRVKVGHGAFSDVYMFTHKLSEGQFEFIEIITASGHSLRATSGHFLYANDVLSAAGGISVGDRVRLGDGSVSPVTSVGKVVDQGIFAPQTVHGDILVNGIVASTYTTFVAPPLAHKLLAPMRALYTWVGISSSLFEMGMPQISKVA